MSYKGTRMNIDTAELRAWDDDEIRLDIELVRGDLKDHIGDNINHVYALFDDANDAQEFINRLQKQLDELKEKRG